MDQGVLFNVFVFLAAACVVVPLTGRFQLGSVIGYLLAGVLIGPFGIGLIGNAAQIMHFAEFGIIMMLFLIGLELDPAALWRLRRSIIGLGGMQVLVTTLAFTVIGTALGFTWQVSFSVGMALSLSSTALVLQIMQEKSLLHTQSGERAFAVLLFQDIAVIPMLLLFPLLAPHIAASVHAHHSALDNLPAWLNTLVVCGVIALIVVLGQQFSRVLFTFIARTNLREVFTATSLALIVGITLLMQFLGVSPALGAFIAGLVLANSEYRHTLMADIEPFKGLLLGLFFISIGMGMDFSILMHEPKQLLGAVALVMVTKAALLGLLGYGFGLRGAQNTWFMLALAQGGEFAFVLFKVASGFALISDEQAAFATLVVALSMAATPLLMLVNERLVAPQFMSLLPQRDYDNIDEHNPVIIAGYGRFGQVVGRFLRAQDVGVTILEKDPEQVELLHKFGSPGYFGDASRLDLLESAGAKKAKLLIIAVDDADKCLEIVRLAKLHFPKLKVLARARNRRHAYELDKAGVDYFYREMFDSSLTMAQEAMRLLGRDPRTVAARAERFREHDEKTLRASFEFFDKEPELISFQRQARDELERILNEDTQVVALPTKRRRKKA